MSEILTISVIQKISKQKIWTIRENDCYYLIKKTAYAYDFGLIGIREKNGSIWKYCYPSENTGIVVTYQNQGNHNTITKVAAGNSNFLCQNKTILIKGFPQFFLLGHGLQKELVPAAADPGHI